MPWTAPTTAVAGNAILASLWNSDVRDNSLMGQPVFTNEAARDAAITSPSEGQVCYLTAPTVPAATGGSTFVPSGAWTVYNGSVWVCVSEVGAYQENLGTTTSTSYTTTLSGSPGTNPSVTLVTGTTALVTIGAALVSNTTNARAALSFTVSGATTLSGGNARAIWQNAQTVSENIIGQILVGGLTAGTNTFTLAYCSLDPSTTQFDFRRIHAKGIV